MSGVASSTLAAFCDAASRRFGELAAERDAALARVAVLEKLLRRADAEHAELSGRLQDALDVVASLTDSSVQSGGL